ncbi:MAG TPA: T9SS type A sorting domain-containing protein [Flavisolibacter sp.]|nr:T9SS type A sorting domain-containing protein [Flavisolibacter sp.]
MKYSFFLAVSIACSVGTSNAQTVQNFDSVKNLNALTEKCWQLLGVTLHKIPAASEASLAVNAASVGGKAWVYTPFADLTTSSAINFTFQLANKLSANATRTLAVHLAGIDGSMVHVGNMTLNAQSQTTAYAFAGKSPATGVRRVVIEITASGDDMEPLYLDNFSIGGAFNYNPPYWCKDRANGTTTIHYLKVFQGLLSGDRVQLLWTVAENENNQFFEIERSTDGQEFQSAAIIKATGRVAVENYNYGEALQGNAYYRLKLVSKSGIRMYSNVLFFKGASAIQDLALLQNPIQQTLKVGFTAERKTTAMVVVYDMSGFKVFQKEYEAGKGYNVIVAELNTNLKKGLYFLELNQHETRRTTKFVKD